MKVQIDRKNKEIIFKDFPNKMSFERFFQIVSEVTLKISKSHRA